MTANLNPFFDQIAGIERALADEDRISRVDAPRFSRIQPVHVVYGGGHLFRPDFKTKLGHFVAYVKSPNKFASRNLLSTLFEASYSESNHPQLPALRQNKLSDPVSS